MTQPNTENTQTEENKPDVQVEEPKKLSYDEMEAELRKVRNEAAQRRISNRELEERAQKWQEYEESQKTELQKLQDALAEREQKLSAYQLKETKLDVAKEFGLDSEDAELLTGSDEATIRKQAEKLKARLGTVKNDAPRPADLLAGNRGAPIGGAGSNVDPVDQMVRRMSRGQ
jgi:hypothetical protein